MTAPTINITICYPPKAGDQEELKTSSDLSFHRLRKPSSCPRAGSSQCGIPNRKCGFPRYGSIEKAGESAGKTIGRQGGSSAASAPRDRRHLALSYGRCLGRNGKCARPSTGMEGKGCPSLQWRSAEQCSVSASASGSAHGVVASHDDVCSRDRTMYERSAFRRRRRPRGRGCGAEDR